MRQTKSLSPTSVVPNTVSLCRLTSVPAARWPFPTLSPRSLYRCLDPYPAVPLRCICSFLPGKHRPYLRRERFGTPNYRRNATSTTGNISGLQSFRYVQAPILARPPGCTHRYGSVSIGQLGRLHHAMNMWLPYMNCGIATCLYRAIDTTGLSPAGLRPCRLLPSPKFPGYPCEYMLRS